MALDATNPDQNKFDIDSFVKPFDYAGQKAETQNWMDEYSAAIPKTYEMYNRQAGVPQLQQQYLAGGQALQGIQGAIAGMPQTVAGTTRDSMVTEAQRSGMVNKNIANLTPALQSADAAQKQTGTALEMAQTTAESQAARAMLPWEKGFTAMQTQQAREFTGYTTNNQLELDRLVANQSAGLQWTNAERSRANELALQEMSYKQALDSINAQGKNQLEAINKQGENDRQNAKYEAVDLGKGMDWGWSDSWLS